MPDNGDAEREKDHAKEGDPNRLHDIFMQERLKQMEQAREAFEGLHETVEDIGAFVDVIAEVGAAYMEAVEHDADFEEAMEAGAAALQPTEGDEDGCNDVRAGLLWLAQAASWGVTEAKAEVNAKTTKRKKRRRGF